MVATALPTQRRLWRETSALIHASGDLRDTCIR